ncbi:MAG TPA: hypothetical protein VGB34_05380 [Candidatus Limnocylindria bacterium]|jgi:hypothetical protein
MEPYPRVSWIVCRGAERDVRDGVVRCPLKGNIDVAHCMECHLLETLAAERDRSLECRADEEAVQVAVGGW